MLFLMNDAILQLDLQALTPPAAAQRTAALPLAAVMKLGAEMFAQTPLLHRSHPVRAQRLAALIVTRAAPANAVLFEVPHAGCRTDQVGTRLAEVAFEVMAELYAQHRSGALSPVLADRRVWRRMAA